MSAMSRHSRAAAGVAALVVVLAVAAAFGTVAAGEGTAAYDNETEDLVEAEGAGGVLEVRVDESAFDGNDTTVTVHVDGSQIGEGLEPDGDADGEKIYRIDLTDRDAADDDLSAATVDVTVGGKKHNGTGVDLRYVALTPDARFDGDGSLRLGVGTVVGVPNRSAVTLSAAAADESRTINATYRAEDEEFVLDRSAEFADLALTGENLTVAGGDDLELDGGTYDVQEEYGSPSAQRSGDSVELTHPLLFEGREYVVTITALRNDTEVVTTRRATARDGELTVTHDGAALDPATVDIEHDGLGLGADEVTAPSARLDASGTVVNVGNHLGENGTADVVIALDGDPENVQTLSDVPYKNGFLRIDDAGYRLANGSYRLLVDAGDDGRFAIRLDAGDDNASVERTESGASSSAVVSVVGIGLSTTELIILVVGVVLLAVLGGVGIAARPTGRSGTGSRGTSANGGRAMRSVQVRVIDEDTEATVTRTVRFKPEKSERTGEIHEHRIAGEDTVRLPESAYEAVTVPGGHSKWVTEGRSSVDIPIPPERERVTVRNAVTGKSVAGATVRVTLPTGETRTDETGDDGVARFDLPGTVDGSECELRVEHDRFRPTTSGLTDAVELEPDTGDARVNAGIGGTPVSDVTVVVKPTGDHARRVAEQRRKTANENGMVVFEGLPSGEYAASLDFGSNGAVEETTTSLRVPADGRVTETIDAAFSFEIRPEQRSRIDDLHADISDLTPPNRDGAIPYYFGSVLSEVLSTVDEFPDAGAAFVRHGVDPVIVTDATIEAVADAVEYTRKAMTSKQNVDLFTACRGLREARVKWDGTVTVDDLVGFVGDEKANHRGEMIDRLESVNESIDSKRTGVSTVTPAQEQYEQTRKHATGLQGLSPVEQRAHFFVGLRMLDAVESVFEHPELVARMEETVF